MDTLAKLVFRKAENLFGFDMAIVCHAEEVCYLCRLLSLVRNVDVTFEQRWFDLCCFEVPIDWFNFVKDNDAW